MQIRSPFFRLVIIQERWGIICKTRVDRVMIKLINFSFSVIACLLSEIGNETDRRNRRGES